MEQTYLTGTLAGAGSLRCVDCGYVVALDSLHEVPECPHCGAAAFERASLFGLQGDTASGGQAASVEDDDGEWLVAVREELAEPGRFLARRDHDRVAVLPLIREWTRIGRSPNADICLDDPTVSRRHALVVCEDERASVLDDRSLNGVFVNDDQIESCELADGDSLLIGRYRLHFLDSTDAIALRGSGASQALA